MATIVFRLCVDLLCCCVHNTVETLHANSS